MKEHLHDATYADELLRLAEADLDSARKLLTTKARIENACFFSEQCVEKSLKSALIKLKIPFRYLYSTRSQSALFDAPFWLQLCQPQKKCSTAWKAASALFFRLPRFAQKCAVKKAHILTASSIHDLGYLLGKLPAEKWPPDGKSIIGLELYAAQRRYEEGPYPATEEDAVESIEIAKRSLDWAKQFRNEP